MNWLTGTEMFPYFLQSVIHIQNNGPTILAETIKIHSPTCQSGSIIGFKEHSAISRPTPNAQITNVNLTLSISMQNTDKKSLYMDQGYSIHSETLSILTPF